MEGFPYCQDPFTRIRVTSEGDVFLCCFQRFHPIGSLLENSIEEIWSSDLAKAVRAEVLAGRLHKVCQVDSCPHGYRDLKPGSSGYQASALPVLLDIDPPSRHCNIGGESPGPSSPACIMCERSDPGHRFEEDHLFEFLPRLRPIIGGLVGLHIQGIAEAFWKDLMFKVLDVLEFSSSTSNARLSTYSNALVFDDRRQEEWLRRCDRTTVSFSVDAGTPETYRRIRSVPGYEVVLKNIRSYVKRIEGSKNHIARIANNINLINLAEIQMMVRQAAELGVREIEFNWTGGHRTDITMNQNNIELFKVAQDLAMSEGQRSGIPVKFLRPFDRPKASYIEDASVGAEKVI